MGRHSVPDPDDISEEHPLTPPPYEPEQVGPAWEELGPVPGQPPGEAAGEAPFEPPPPFEPEQVGPAWDEIEPVPGQPPGEAAGEAPFEPPPPFEPEQVGPAWDEIEPVPGQPPGEAAGEPPFEPPPPYEPEQVGPAWDEIEPVPGQPPGEAAGEPPFEPPPPYEPEQVGPAWDEIEPVPGQPPGEAAGEAPFEPPPVGPAWDEIEPVPGQPPGEAAGGPPYEPAPAEPSWEGFEPSHAPIAEPLQPSDRYWEHGHGEPGSEGWEPGAEESSDDTDPFRQQGEWGTESTGPGPQERADWAAGEYPPPQEPPPPGSEFHDSPSSDGPWQGGHRKEGRRGVSIGIIVALILVVVAVAGFIGWQFFGDALSGRGSTAAERCVSGDQTLPVVADAAIADKIREFADRYNKSAGPVGDHCIRVDVKSADSDTVLKGFAGQWPGDLGSKPALWIPGSSVSTDRLEAQAGPKAVTDSKSLVTSPVLLAIKPQLKPVLDQQNWGTLPGIQTNPRALDDLNLPGWGSLRLALPATGASDASYLAAEAVAVASAPSGAPATAGLGAVNTLIGGQPELPNDSLSAAMDALLTDGDPAAGTVHAVVVTEQEFYHRSTGLKDAKNVVASWLPPGPVALADYPTALLSGDWVSKEQATAASEFSKFLRKPEQLADLAKAGFRAEGTSSPKSDVTGFGPLGNPLKIDDPQVRVMLANAIGTSAGGPAVTIMLDQSMPAEEGGQTRLANVVAALKDRLQALPPTSAVGLWTFDGVEGRDEVPTGPLADPIGGQPRSNALTAALDKQFSSGGGAVSFTTLQMIYDQTLAGFRPNAKNSILVITTGPHTDRSLDGPGLEKYIRDTFDPARPLAVNVIDFGDDPDRATWEVVAQATGGAYTNLPTSASPDLAAAVASFLG